MRYFSKFILLIWGFLNPNFKLLIRLFFNWGLIGGLIGCRLGFNLHVNWGFLRVYLFICIFHVCICISTFLTLVYCLLVFTNGVYNFEIVISLMPSDGSMAKKSWFSLVKNFFISDTYTRCMLYIMIF